MEFKETIDYINKNERLKELRKENQQLINRQELLLITNDVYVTLETPKFEENCFKKDINFINGEIEELEIHNEELRSCNNALHQLSYTRHYRTQRDQAAMYGARGVMMGNGAYSDGGEGSSERQCVLEANPYFASNSYGNGSGTSNPYFASNSYDLKHRTQRDQAAMYGARGVMMGSGAYSDGVEGSSERQCVLEANPYFASNSYGNGSGTSNSYFAINSYDLKHTVEAPVTNMATLKLGKNVIRPSGHPDEGSSKQQPNPYFASNRYVYGSGLSYPYFASNSYGNGNGFAGVRLKGLPFNCSETDIIIFFVGLDIINIFLVKNISGEAFVVFTTQLQVKYALCRDKQYMRQRYIEVFRCEEKEYYDAVTSGYKVLRLQGLPFTVKKKDIVAFFIDFEIAEDKVQIVCGADGIPSGDAFVEFVSGEVAKRAMCKDRQTIGSRYVILFFSTPDEAERTVSKFRQ